MAEGISNEVQLEALHKTLLETLDGEQRAQLVKSMEEPEKAFRSTMQQQDDEMQDVEQELQTAVADYEEAQRVLADLEDEDAKPDAAVVEKARVTHREASTAMEACMSERKKIAATVAEAKAVAKEKRLTALRSAVERFSGALAKEEQDKSPTSVTGSTAPFEPLQEMHADLVIRLGRFDKVGVVVKSDGVIETAPGGLFNSDYQVIGIDGKRFVPGLENSDGTHTIILRCRNADMLASLHRVPAKFLKGKALKLMQVKITPGDRGFGIDLSEVNHVAGLVKGGKAEEADLRVGDVVVAVDGVGIGKGRLIDVLRKGRPSYVFNVVRPAAAVSMDRADELVDAGSSAPSQPAALSAKPNGVEPKPAAAPAASDSGADDLMRSLNESLGRMQQSAEMLAGPAVRIARTTPKDGTAITVEWTPRPGAPTIAHYHLQWKLVDDREWTHTEASKKLAATVVTKGNLKPNGLYQFRVRACSKQSGEWGAWCPATAPVAPTSEAQDDEALSTIQEEASEVNSVAPSAKPASPGANDKAQVWSDLPAASAGAGAPGTTLAMDVVNGLLKDQRQALEAQSAENLTAVQAELETTREEIEDWKAKFLEMSGNTMQQVLDAKEATRAEVLAELEAERKAVEEMKAEASQAVELIRAAEAAQAEAEKEAAHYKKRFDDAKAEAKAETDKEADVKVNHVMRNAALELRDKVKFVEQQTDATVKRAVDEALRLAEARAEASRCKVRHDLEAAHEKQMQAMRDMVGAGAKHRIGEIQAAQDDRVEAAVRQARTEEREAAARSGAAAVQTAVAEAIEETATKHASRQGVLELQLVSVRKEHEARLADMYTEDQMQSLVRRAKEEARAQHAKALQQASERTREAVAHERQKALESVSETIRKSVRDREMELLAENGKGLQDLADKELKDNSRVVLHAGQQAAKQWDAGNDDFEESVLKKTQPVVQSHAPTGPPDASKKPAKGSKLTAAELKDHDDIESYSSLARGQKAANGVADDDNEDAESMVAPPAEYLRLKARHRAELQAMVARQSIDQYREEENEEAEDDTARKEGRARRAAEKEELKKRQFKEAMAAGQNLVNETRASQARDGDLNPSEFQSATEDDIRSRSAKHPELRKAFDKVNALESQLRAIQDGGPAGGAVQVDRGDNMLARDNVQSILQRGASKGGITDAEREGLQEVMDLLQKHMARDQSMRTMLQGLTPQDAAAHETASCVGQELERDEDQMGALALQLQEMLVRDTSAQLNEDELALLRQLASELKSQQEQAEMREAQITWLQAEAKRARLTALLDARAELEAMHSEALEGDKLALPTTPISAAEDGFSIAVDWVAPETGLAVKYHLQWRSNEDSTWTSSAGSESLSVPCCTKGHLRAQLAYQFRVRAADKDGRWGPWSSPTEPTSPNVLLNSLPSRPQLRALQKGRVEARWSPPEGAAAVAYELEWRTCEGQWGEPSSSMQCDGVIATTPSLVSGTYYTFRVRASIERHRGRRWTEWSPSSPPVTIGGGTKSGKGDGKAVKAKSLKDRPPMPQMPTRTDDEATETVIEADLRGVLSGLHPTAQAAMEAKLGKVSAQRAEDAANVKTLEQRNRAIATKTREEQMEELVRMKRAALNRAVANGEAVGGGDEPTKPATDSWD